MTAKERLENLLIGNPVDRPPFMPAIYDLKPALINSAPHTFGQNKQEIIDALTFESDKLKADSLTVGYDIYNVEAEAVGCSVLRDPTIGMPEIIEPLIDKMEEAVQLSGLNSVEGRMGIFIGAAKQMIEDYGKTIPVRGGVSGPFSMATKIIPKEVLLMETVMNSEGLIPLLRFCTETIKIYAKGFSAIGAGVIVFDSFVTPPLLSPESYHDVVLPFHREIFEFLGKQGVNQRTLIIGGNTLPVLNEILNTGATQFLLDYTIPLEEVRAVLQEFPDKVFRVNLDPNLFISQNSEELEAVTEKTLRTLKEFQNLIIGTGILSPTVPLSNILATRNQILNFYN